MLIINSSYTFYRSNKIAYTFAKNNYYPRAIYEKKTHQFVYVYLYTDINELNNQNA